MTVQSYEKGGQAHRPLACSPTRTRAMLCTCTQAQTTCGRTTLPPLPPPSPAAPYFRLPPRPPS